MSEEEFQVLLQDVKDYLHITWQDEKTDRNLTGMIKRGMARLTNIAGVPTLDFSVEDFQRQLLLDYCRYANSHALEMFEINFASELLSLHIDNQARVVQDENKST